MITDMVDLRQNIKLPDVCCAVPTSEVFLSCYIVIIRSLHVDFRYRILASFIIFVSHYFGIVAWMLLIVIVPVQELLLH